jgi:spore germination protein YaaH/putative cell wall-binding protein
MALSLLATTSTAVRATDPPVGSVLVADGRILPPAPSEIMQPSIQGQELLDHTTSSALPTSGGAQGLDSAGTVQLAPFAYPAGAAMGPAGPLPNGLRKEVLGFLPYWMLDADSLAALRYDLVSTIAYFSIGASASGALVRSGSGWTGWSSTALPGVVASAHARGVRVVPTITLMSWSGDYTNLTTLLNTPANRAKLISEIAGIIGASGTDGVNVDFEPVPSSLRDAFTQFVRELKAGLVSAGVGSYVTVDTMAGAASWATGYDVTALSAPGAADALMVMAYDFSWSGSARAGGVAPIKSPYIFDATDSLQAYLSLVDPAKLIWGIPYYGRTWATAADTLNARTCASDATLCPDAVAGSLASKAYYYVGSLSQATQYGRRWDDVGGVPWYAWYDTANKVWRQGYYDDTQSLRLKYDLVNDNGLAGVGIWTLGMDTGRSELWNLIDDRFVKTVERLGGADRYATAALISSRFFGTDVPVAFIATGSNFPDALAAGPAAAMQRGPLLLVQRGELPDATAAELQRLRPRQIVVLGDTAAVSAAVASQLASYTSGQVRRVAGSDRYQTAAAVSAAFFNPGVSTAFIATGLDYPDALAGVGYAAKLGAPVLLTNPGALPAATRNELARLKPGRIIVLGGTASVSDAVAGALAAYTTGGVTRLAGVDRYATAAAISAAAFGADAPTSAFLATGSNFPDALAGAAAAGMRSAPLLLVKRDEIPAPTAAEIQRLNAPHSFVLGLGGTIASVVIDQLRALWD